MGETTYLGALSPWLCRSLLDLAESEEALEPHRGIQVLFPTCLKRSRHTVEVKSLGEGLLFCTLWRKIYHGKLGTLKRQLTMIGSDPCPPYPIPPDRFFKEVLSRREEARELLLTYLPQEVARPLDADSLELAKDSFVDKELQKHFFSDLLYRVTLKGGVGGLMSTCWLSTKAIPSP